jgi:hypothetical protein
LRTDDRRRYTLQKWSKNVGRWNVGGGRREILTFPPRSKSEAEIM